MRLRTWVMGVVLGAVCVAAGSGQEVKITKRHPASAPASVPRIELSSAVLDFGEVWQGTPVKGDFTIKNVGDAPLVIEEVKTSCGCAATSKPKTQLLPGESDVLTISYDSLKRTGIARQMVTIRSNDPAQRSIVIGIEGTVKPLYSLDPASGVSFDSLRSDSSETLTVKILSQYDKPLRLGLKGGQDLRPFDVTLTETKPGAEYALTVKTLPPLSGRAISVPVFLETDVPQAPELLLMAHAYVWPDVTCSRTVLRVPRQSIIAKEEWLDVRSRSDRPVKVTQVRASHESIRCELKEPAASSGDWVIQKIHVVLPPGGQLPPGDSQIEIQTDSPDPQYQRFEVRVQVVETPARSGPATQPATRPAAAEEPGRP